MKKVDGKGKGFAFVQFKDPEDAVKAYEENDSTIFQGRLLHIISAKAKKDTKLDEFEISKLPQSKPPSIGTRCTSTPTQSCLLSPAAWGLARQSC
jgi:multiple RNA-binding domain-containing protein 1